MPTLAPIFLAQPSRAAGLPRPLARALLAIVAVALLASLLALAAPIAVATDASPGAGRGTDLELYAAIVDGVRYQGGYYRVAADALRTGGYPLQPFLAMRLPTLATVQAVLPPMVVPLLLWILAAATLLAWYARLAPAFARPTGRFAVVLLLIGGGLAGWQADLAAFHELWAGLLVALSLARHRADRPLEAMAWGLAAALVRETGALYLLVMAAAALWERRRTEALGWGAALGLFAVVLAVHAHAVSLVTRPLDPASPGWSGLLGPGFAIRSLVVSGALLALPMLVAAPLVTLGIVGWAGWREPLGLRVLATLAAYLLLLALFARADNFYWALLVAPLSLVGLVFAPDLLRDLFAAALDTRRITVRRVVR